MQEVFFFFLSSGGWVKIKLKIPHTYQTHVFQVDWGSWIRWLVSRIRSCADKLGDGKEIDTVQRTAKRYDDDGDGKYVGLRLLLLADVMMAARALPPRTSRHRMTKQRGAGQKYSQLCVV